MILHLISHDAQLKHETYLKLIIANYIECFYQYNSLNRKIDPENNFCISFSVLMSIQREKPLYKFTNILNEIL